MPTPLNASQQYKNEIIQIAGNHDLSTTGEIVWNNAIPNSNTTYRTTAPIGFVDVETQIDGATTRNRTYAYNANGSVNTETVTDGTDTFILTYNYDGNGNYTSDTGYVKQ